MISTTEMSELPYYSEGFDVISVEPVMKDSKWGGEGSKYVSGYRVTLTPIGGSELKEVEFAKADPILGALLYFAHNPDKTQGQCVRFGRGEDGKTMKVWFPKAKVVEK